MSAQEQMRAMLDELMGTARDGRLFMCCSPSHITKRMDLGECPKFHDLALRADYDQASRRKDYFYDIDAMEHLSSFIADCDRKTEVAKRRLKETQEELSEEANQKAEMIHKLGEEMGTKLAKAEDLGAEGNVTESLRLMEEVEDLKKKKAAAEMEYRNSMPASSYQQQKLRVCEVCSAYLGIHDNDRRLADHFGGKLHLGFITIREKLEDLKKSLADRRAQREKDREEQKLRRLEREKMEEEQRNSGARSRSRSRKRSRSFSRDRRRSRSRSRSRSRMKRRSRSRSRNRHSRKKSSRRSRSRSRSRRSRSRDRRKRRSRSRSRRSRSRSRSRSRRSRSRSRHKRRHRSRSRSRSRSRDKRSHRKRRSRSNSLDDERRSTSSEKRQADVGNDMAEDGNDFV